MKVISGRFAVLLTLFLVVALAAPLDADWFRSGSHDTIKGSGKLTTEKRDIESFDRIENFISADITVRIGEPQKVELTFDDNLIDLVTTEVRGSTLEIRSERSYSSRKGCKIEIVVPSLEQVGISGSGDMNVSGLKCEDFELDIHGSGDFEGEGEVKYLSVKIHGSGDTEFRDLVSDEVSVSIYGSGDVYLDGEVAEFDVSINGSGDVDARRLEADDVTVAVYGSGDVYVKANDRLSAKITGSGDVTYYGNPKDVNRRIYGSGSLRKH
jgi:hypothetical protein